MYLTKNHRWSAILISLFILIILTIMTTVFMEKLLSFAKSSEWIENSNVAYYYALGSIEESLYTWGVNKYTPWNIKNISYGTTTSTGRNILAITWWQTIPFIGNGNSPYDNNWNLISRGDPVQIVIPAGITWNSVQLFFRVPQIEPGSNTWVHSTIVNSGVILWTLTSTGNSLFASGETNVFIWNNLDGQGKYIHDKYGNTNTWALMQFDSFYNAIAGTNCTNYKCTLKLSMIRDVLTNDGAGKPVSFIEYKITGFNVSIPQEFMKIQATGYANGFLRTRTLELPQITTNNALDFAVLQ